MAALGLSCGMRDLSWWHVDSSSFCQRAYLLHGKWDLVPQPGMEPPPPALQGRFLTTGPPKKSLIMTFRSLGKELRKMLSWVDVEETIHHTFLTSGAASTYLGFCGSQHNTAVLCVKNKGHPKGVISDSKPDQTDMSRNSLKFKWNTKQFVSSQIGASQVILVSI